MFYILQEGFVYVWIICTFCGTSSRMKATVWTTNSAWGRFFSGLQTGQIHVVWRCALWIIWVIPKWLFKHRWWIPPETVWTCVFDPDFDHYFGRSKKLSCLNVRWLRRNLKSGKPPENQEIFPTLSSAINWQVSLKSWSLERMGHFFWSWRIMLEGPAK